MNAKYYRTSSILFQNMSNNTVASDFQNFRLKILSKIDSGDQSMLNSPEHRREEIIRQAYKALASKNKNNISIQNKDMDESIQNFTVPHKASKDIDSMTPAELFNFEIPLELKTKAITTLVTEIQALKSNRIIKEQSLTNSQEYDKNLSSDAKK